VIRLSWRQFRGQVLVVAGLLLAVGVVLAVTGPALLHNYDTTVAGCAAQGDCGSATAQFLTQYIQLQQLGPVLVFVPALIGIFWGAPLVARELETGTFRLAWTQSVTRRRWMGVKLGLIGLASVAASGLLSLMVTWWSSPLDRAQGIPFSTFDQRGFVSLGYAAFAFALGVTFGVLTRRTLPAMASTLAAFVAVRLMFDNWVRPRLMPPVHQSLPVGASGSVKLFEGPRGLDVLLGNLPALNHAWLLNSQLVDASGHAPTNAFLQRVCPSIAALLRPSLANGPTGVARKVGNDPMAAQCVASIAAKFHAVVTYQPSSRYWPFQGIETGIYLAAALALAGFSFWWVRHRIP
jgi:hypothetical protein